MKESESNSPVLPPVGSLEVAGGAPDAGRSSLGPVVSARADMARTSRRPAAAAGHPGQPLRQKGGRVPHDVLVHEATRNGLDGGGHGRGRVVACAVAEVAGAGADAGGGAGGGGAAVEGTADAVASARAAAAAEGRVSRDGGGVRVRGPRGANVAIFILRGISL